MDGYHRILGAVRALSCLRRKLDSGSYDRGARPDLLFFSRKDEIVYAIIPDHRAWRVRCTDRIVGRYFVI